MASSASLFGGMEEEVVKEPPLPDIKHWNDKETLARERQVIGFYLSDHPLRKYELEYKTFASVHLGETESIEEMDDVRACGVITDLKIKIDRSGKTMAFFTLDDFTGSCECLIFSKTYAEYGQFISEEETVFIIGNLESSGDAIKMQVSKVIPLNRVANELTESIKIIIDKDKVKSEVLLNIKPILEKYKGSIPVFIHLCENGSSKGKLFSLTDYRIKINPDLIGSLSKLLGEESIMLKAK
jgi:DNA polymerase-3 subunit alpha